MNRQAQGRRRARAPVPSAGRPNTLGKDKKVVNFAVPYQQWADASEKSQQGRVFNVAELMRLLHKHLFVNVPLRKAQALLRQLIKLDEGDGRIEDVTKWLRTVAGRKD